MGPIENVFFVAGMGLVMFVFGLVIGVRMSADGRDVPDIENALRAPTPVHAPPPMRPLAKKSPQALSPASVSGVGAGVGTGVPAPARKAKRAFAIGGEITVPAPPQRTEKRGMAASRQQPRSVPSTEL